jgi:hypothetical protein
MPLRPFQTMPWPFGLPSNATCGLASTRPRLLATPGGASVWATCCPCSCRTRSSGGARHPPFWV